MFQCVVVRADAFAEQAIRKVELIIKLRRRRVARVYARCKLVRKRVKIQSDFFVILAALNVRGSFHGGTRKENKKRNSFVKYFRLFRKGRMRVWNVIESSWNTVVRAVM